MDGAGVGGVQGKGWAPLAHKPNLEETPGVQTASKDQQLQGF